MKDRWIRSPLQHALRKPFVHILFGARQTGKTTLLKALVANPALQYNLADPGERTRLMSDPGVMRRECEALPRTAEPQVISVDEAQLVPSVFDSVQVMYDNDKTRWRFVLCGSSARKLRRTGANLLPGRCLLHRLYPLVLPERPPQPWPPETCAPLLPLDESVSLSPTFPPAGLEERLAYGELPGIAMLDEADRGAVLKSFVTVHLEEEIRREALVKDWGAFVNFLRLAAQEAGQVVSFAGISREIGLSQPTVKSYYQLLEDMFIGFQVPAYSKSSRKRLLSTPKFLFFDLGVRHAASGLTPSRDVVTGDPGRWLEQWVGIELWKRLQYRGDGQLHHLRTKHGTEIDFIVERGDRVMPIEVKWTERPSLQDARHLTSFVKENPRAPQGYLVCRCPRPMKLSEHVTALPWFCL
ncbi:MAG: ATP-binding protein [Planctomycetes bacterium]|nr:ATP-binding protein [Planctomycetota bacterium]MBM4084683.1 ATP-binding protein [Planctomycetota bacterium]